MKMSEFEVGKRYWNTTLHPRRWCELREDGYYYDNNGHPWPHSKRAITRDDWAMLDPHNPCDEAWEKASFGCAFPCCHDEQCAFSLEKAKEWFIIGWQARQDHALEIGK